MLVRPLLLAAVVVTQLVTPVAAGRVEVRVADDRGDPLEDAVVFLAGGTPPPGRSGLRAVMSQRDREFVPRVLPILAGTAVSFPDHDDVRHHVYSFSPAHKFELATGRRQPDAPIVFDTPGVVVLGCSIHDWMLGYVYVLTTPQFTKTGADGRARIDGVPAGPWRARVWHPRLRGAESATTQAVAVPASGTVSAVFTIALTREWRLPRPFIGRSERAP
ncbi:MAG: hypothetical protein HY294_10360 [Candidatus Rokubacteria bacterium]|nr:hypothetical protein [Candidatus Rokubacteria bacterium]MBI3826388.1 hypothetical protein [Candidatus Rokubacteria bacterium]